ncbi:hypothetical protein [Streptococcus ovuberis]|uniref:Uncharacterized protein n=1 Tax=Streptococcus ovuberis TaxID=1936207 RepID=A0A7X6N024_9STRE|nr:hypothetical protein [Streptococcus ovuberis]NKZ19569.1 hypothetical protein [Streptococcus ovuberis]
MAIMAIRPLYLLLGCVVYFLILRAIRRGLLFPKVSFLFFFMIHLSFSAYYYHHIYQNKAFEVIAESPLLLNGTAVLLFLPLASALIRKVTSHKQTLATYLVLAILLALLLYLWLLFFSSLYAGWV